MKRIVTGSIVIAAIAGVAYLATLGCCQLLGVHGTGRSLIRQLKLTPAQAQAVAVLEKDFLAQKEISCQTLCSKRAQMIQLLKQPVPDPAVLGILTEEIGREQGLLEKATLEHLIAVGRHLEPAQRQKLTDLMMEQLRSACRMTACGVTPGCAVTGRGERAAHE
ncbi:MAG: periplasmic heavy metal sensor [Candidatus Omnitrophica bacterium]|nr:periplasmic heavy metal sensor [Candidatus Omnitrophota bacterium]